MAFLTIIEDDQTFEYQPFDLTSGQRMESVFVLRIVPDSVMKDLRQQYTKPVWEQHQRIERMDDMAFGRALVDYAIVDWRGIKSARSDDDLPCTPEMKAKLPETVKADIIRLCAAKEAGAAVREAAEEKKRSSSSLSGKPTGATKPPAA